MHRLNIYILGFSEVRLTETGKIISDDVYFSGDRDVNHQCGLAMLIDKVLLLIYTIYYCYY